MRPNCSLPPMAPSTFRHTPGDICGRTREIPKTEYERHARTSYNNNLRLFFQRRPAFRNREMRRHCSASRQAYPSWRWCIRRVRQQPWRRHIMRAPITRFWDSFIGPEPVRCRLRSWTARLPAIAERPARGGPWTHLSGGPSCRQPC
jgi:hypothetical protein